MMFVNDKAGFHDIFRGKSGIKTEIRYQMIHIFNNKLKKSKSFSSLKPTGVWAWGCLFLLHALEQGASACPNKSGHTRNAEMTMIRHGGRCPDLLGSAGALLLGHETKKASPYSHERFIFYSPTARL